MYHSYGILLEAKIFAAFTFVLPGTLSGYADRYYVRHLLFKLYQHKKKNKFYPVAIEYNMQEK